MGEGNNSLDRLIEDLSYGVIASVLLAIIIVPIVLFVKGVKAFCKWNKTDKVPDKYRNASSLSEVVNPKNPSGPVG